MRLNLFYPVVALLGIALFFLFRPPAETEISFFGFAESSETAINYNYPVVIDDILVRPGQSVREGETLLRISRRTAKETLADQQYRIAELRAEERLWRAGKRSELEALRLRAANTVAEDEAQLAALREELAYKRSLAADLKTIDLPAADYQPLVSKIKRLESELARQRELAGVREQGLRSDLRLGSSPYAERIRRLEADAAFEADKKVQPFTVTAPADGLIGNVSVREGEHIPSYQTLLTFYEPHSNLVRGFVHEDQTLRVGLGDRFEVYSLKAPGIRYAAKVIGLGSRIIETPTRLRQLPDFKTYGREVVLEIPADNQFLQKEKVGVRTVNATKTRDQ